MSKLTPEAFDAFVRGGATSLKGVLFYGQDEGLVGEYREKSVKAVVGDAKDPLRITQLEPAGIKADPSLLGAEANAVSMFGGRRVIVIRGADNYFTATIKDFFASYSGDTLIVITAGGLKTKDSLPSFFEKTAGLGVIPCYADDEGALKRLVFQTLDNAGMTATNDVISYIAENLGADRLVSRSELNKLLTYMGAEKTVKMEDAMACIGDASALSIDQFLYALSGGDQKTMNETLDRLYAEGEKPITLLRAASAHLKKFHLAAGKIADGAGVNEAVASLFLHFKRVDQFKDQLRQWTLPKIARALDLLTTAETDCKRTGRPQNLICARVFLQIASQARRR